MPSACQGGQTFLRASEACSILTRVSLRTQFSRADRMTLVRALVNILLEQTPVRRTVSFLFMQSFIASRMTHACEQLQTFLTAIGNERSF